MQLERRIQRDAVKQTCVRNKTYLHSTYNN